MSPNKRSRSPSTSTDSSEPKSAKTDSDTGKSSKSPNLSKPSKKSISKSTSPSSKRSRSKRACTKCQSRKTKCSGEKPCSYCIFLKKPDECVFIIREKPTMVTLQESYLNSLKMRIQELEQKVLEENTAVDIIEKSLNNGSYLNKEKPSKGSSKDSKFAEKSTNRRMALTHIINSESDAKERDEVTKKGSEYVLEKELAVKNILVDTDVPYLSNINVFLGNSNCTKFNLTVESILTEKLNSIISSHNLKNTPKLPPPMIPTIFYKSTNLHWNKLSLESVVFPEKNYAVSLVNLLFESLGHDLVVVNRYETFQMIERIFDNYQECEKLEVIQFLALVGMGESLIAAKASHEGKFESCFPGFLYFQQAIQLFEDVFEECTLTYIETCLLFAIYSLALNRTDTAYVYTGLAIRLAHIMGLHRKIGANFNNGLTKYELEKRIRLWWSCYIWDRVVTIRLGHPVMINDDSMDVDLPSNRQFTTPQEIKYYPKPPSYFIEQIKLARISGILLSKIYGIKTGKFKDSFIVSVHSILNILRYWFNELSASDIGSDGTNNVSKSNNSLKLDYSSLDANLKRQTYSLHLNYNYCIILTTRPLLLYVFKETLFNTEESEYSPTTLGILKSCINASLINLKILHVLTCHDSYAMYALMDNNYIFSSVVILMLINTIKDYNSKGYNLFTKIFYKPNDSKLTLTHMEITSKIKFAIAMLQKGSNMGSVTAKIYYLQITGFSNLLEKLNHVRNKNSGDSIEKRIDDVTKNVVTDASLYNKLNQVLYEHENSKLPKSSGAHGSSSDLSSSPSDIGEKSLKELALGAMGIQTPIINQYSLSYDSSSTTNGYVEERSNNNTLSVANLEREYLGGNQLNLLNDEMLTGFLDYNGWQKNGAPDKAFSMFQNDFQNPRNETTGSNGKFMQDYSNGSNAPEANWQFESNSSSKDKPKGDGTFSQEIGFYDDIMNVFTTNPQDK